MSESTKGWLTRLFQACVIGGCVAATPAQAVVISGSFVGAVTGASWGLPFADVPVTGEFSFDLDQLEPQPEAGPGVWFSGADGRMSVEFAWPTGPAHLSEEQGILLWLDDGASGLVVNGWRDGFTQMTLRIAAADSTPWALGGDLRTLRPGAIDLAGSSFGFSTYRSYGAGALSALHVAPSPAAPVPEPVSALLLLAGLGLVGWRQARRSRDAGASGATPHDVVQAPSA